MQRPGGGKIHALPGGSASYVRRGAALFFDPGESSLMSTLNTSAVPASPEQTRRPPPSRGGLLCVANFPANTGYAWRFIEEVYASLADHFAERGVATWVAYPQVALPPETLGGSAARAVELEVQPGTLRGLRPLVRFVREHDIRVLYMADRTSWSPAYAALRLAGIRWIVVHDHTSGTRTTPRGVKRVLKRQRQRLPGSVADRVVAVSDFVARRKLDVDLLPANRVVRVWNTLPVAGPDSGAGIRLRNAFGLGPSAVVACACRATPEKGVAHLLRAFDRYCGGLARQTPWPSLVYFGDGPALGELQRVRAGLAAANHIVFAGYRKDAQELTAGADVCVVPSLWQEAFGLAVLEPMTRGVPVIASRVGGIPEVIEDGMSGVLTEPGDEAALADALRRVLGDAGERRRLGENGLERARSAFSRERALRELVRLLEPGFETR
jgi:glycosyltransferase involved in cell wall biosynthesis